MLQRSKCSKDNFVKIGLALNYTCQLNNVAKSQYNIRDNVLNPPKSHDQFIASLFEGPRGFKLVSLIATIY